MITEEKRYSVNEVFELIGEEHLNIQHNVHKTNIVVDGFDVHPQSLRYATFYQKGTKCACCGKEGVYFQLCGEENSNRRHFNLYAEDGTLMTKDHIVPKSKNGVDFVENLQTMCVDCNKEKDSKCEGLEIEYIVGTDDKGKEIVFTTIEKASYYLAMERCGAKYTSKGKKEAMKISIKCVMKLLSAIEDGTPYCGYMWKKERR
jgi:hypothetical protein